ncbi:VOC family protein [Mesonia maritima]|uniref:VOC domain-containing protein n=1 Tax=Mesonia maritima TaxID=1793873 RepID=A0ABU1K9V2_9FLAO|nr:VOC family protein [Mesonia maritima]MDR6302035.1 hypothetical protein [Mesonia maritima]
MKNLQPFHLAIPVHDLNEARVFYGEVLGLTEGRSSEKWVDFNFYGHQFVIHETQEPIAKITPNNVDGKSVPIPHFGVVLLWNDFHSLAEKLQQKKIKFEISPYIRFKGKPGEQATMFFYDPSHNALEFKAFRDPEQLFAN